MKKTKYLRVKNYEKFQQYENPSFFCASSLGLNFITVQWQTINVITDVNACRERVRCSRYGVLQVKWITTFYRMTLEWVSRRINSRRTINLQKFVDVPGLLVPVDEIAQNVLHEIRSQSQHKVNTTMTQSTARLRHDYDTTVDIC